MTKNKELTSNVSNIMHYIISVILFIILYELIRTFILIRLPSIYGIILVAVEDILNGSIITHISVSLTRVALGYFIGALFGIIIGILMGYLHLVDLLISPIYSLLRATPPISFVTLFILWFGIGEFPKIILIAFAVCMVMIIPTYHAIKDVPTVYINAALTLGAKKRHVLFRVILRAASPRILEALRSSLQVAWAVLLAAELIASASGIGYYIIYADWYYNLAAMLFGILNIGFIGYILDRIAYKVILKYTKWLERV